MGDDMMELHTSSALERLWFAGREACRDIWRFKPDVVIVLYHSGQSVLRATQAVWDVIGIDPFPPVVGINFGREKAAAFRRHASQEEMEEVALFGAFQDADLFSRWAGGKRGWEAAVHDRVAPALGSADPPACVLVLDDVLGTELTRVLVHGVLTALYPSISILYQVAESGTAELAWQVVLGFWVLFTCFPELGLTAHDNPYASDSCSALGCTLEEHLGRIVVGTEDVRGSSLAWRPLTAGNPHVRAWRDHIPEAVLLELSEWVYAEIEGYARDRTLQEGVWAQ